MVNAIIYINQAILIYFILSVILYVLILYGSFPTIRRLFNLSVYSNREDIAHNKNLPPVTVMMPMYNERDMIKNSLLSVLNSTYPNLYVLVVNDGSTDDSLAYLIDEFKLKTVPVLVDVKFPTKPIKQFFISDKHVNLMVIDKENGGAADSHNAALNVSFTPYVLTMDADSVISPTAIINLMYEMMIRQNSIAAGGGVYILNGCQVEEGKIIQSRLPSTYTSGIQSAEYLRSHLFNRTGWNVFGGTMSYSGTATIFNRRELIDAGGFDVGNYAQDSEIIMRLHRKMHEKKWPYSISFTPAAAVWTDVPDSLPAFGKQRDHWRRGLLRSVLKNMKLLFNPKCGIQGMFGFPVYIFLEILAPYVECLAYFTVGMAYYFGILDGLSAILYIILAWGFASLLTSANTFISIITFNRYERISDIFIMLGYAFLEMFGFRQYYVVINIYGTIHYIINRLRGKPQ